MTTNLIPLAGQGQRFLDAGYETPKPLITVQNVPMIVAAAKALPKGDKYVFLCREDHIRNSAIDKVLLSHFENCEIISVAELTEGQACTCLLGEKAVDPESELTIGTCDNSMLYKREDFDEAINKEEVDAIIWTFRNNPTVERNPKMYGWVKTEDLSALKISVKIPISEDPIHDHAVIGAFSFKKARYFFENAKKMIEQNRRINNEFYVDECMNLLIENGLNVKVFEVDKYICWGTPDDLKTYEYWEKYFKLMA